MFLILSLTKNRAKKPKNSFISNLLLFILGIFIYVPFQLRHSKRSCFSDFVQ